MRQLVMIPGHLCDERLYAPQHEALASIRHVTIPVLDDQDSMQDMARSILHQVSGAFDVLGLSMGGYVALEVIRQAPERVRSLISMNSMAEAESSERRAMRLRLLELSQHQGFERVHEQLLPRFLSPRRVHDQRLRDIVRLMAARIGEAGFRKQISAIINRPDYVETLTRITCPTLIVGSADDDLIPPARQREMAEGIPGADLFVLGDCGHLSTLERPDIVSSMLACWLKSLPD